jgi:hypothetical protein
VGLTTRLIMCPGFMYFSATLHADNPALRVSENNVFEWLLKAVATYLK